MGIIRNHLLQMKVEQPEEYNRLMEGYNSETEFVRDVLGLTTKALKQHTDSYEPKKRTVVRK